MADDEASTDGDNDESRKKARKAGNGSKSKGKATEGSKAELSLLEVLPVELVVEVRLSGLTSFRSADR